MAPPIAPELIVTDDVARAAAERFLSLLPRTVALAGGSTPRPTYERLATSAFSWSATELFFSDERCVPPDHEASNYRMAHEALLSKVPARVHRMPGESCDAESYQREMAAVFGNDLPHLDLVLLGLGEDGHTASLFPGDAALSVVDRWVARVERPDYRRLTLTLSVLSAASTALFLVSGSAKRGALQGLMRGEDIPAARVTANQVIVIADRDAAP
jgi:6-phosphogluconolactonase